MDLFDFLVICTVCFVCTAFLAGGATELALDTFGAGFLPYRGPGWPRGVQEGEPVRFNLAAMTDRAVRPIDREPAPDSPAEIFEIEADAWIEANLRDIDRGGVTRGSSLRD
jgi:hypothetical protein